MSDQSRRDEQDDKTPLQQSMEKALEMKQAAPPAAKVPEDRTAHQGGITKAQVDSTDTYPGREGTHTENLSRSHGARVGDTGKTTGPGKS